jgi:hypothetical protein
VTIRATFDNSRGDSATFDAVLRVDGETASSVERSIPAGETEMVTFEHTFESSGVHEVEVNDTVRTVAVDADGAAPGPIQAGGFPRPVHVGLGVVGLLASVVALSRWI